MSVQRPTPAALRELAAAADSLAERIDAVRAVLRAEDAGARRRAGYRLDDAAGHARLASRALDVLPRDVGRVSAT